MVSRTTFRRFVAHCWSIGHVRQVGDLVGSTGIRSPCLGMRCESRGGVLAWRLAHSGARPGVTAHQGRASGSKTSSGTTTSQWSHFNPSRNSGSDASRLQVTMAWTPAETRRFEREPLASPHPALHSRRANAQRDIACHEDAPLRAKRQSAGASPGNPPGAWRRGLTRDSGGSTTARTAPGSWPRSVRPNSGPLQPVPEDPRRRSPHSRDP